MNDNNYILISIFIKVILSFNQLFKNMTEIQKINYLVVHCSDTPNTSELKAIEIHKMHLSFKWDGIGYHKIICRDGTVENGRPEYWVGAHVYNFNKESLGVCLIGRDRFTKNQFQSLETLLERWTHKYPYAKIVGHNNFQNTKKTCPNFDVLEWWKKINK